MADIPVNASPAYVVVDVDQNGQTEFGYNFRVDEIDDIRAIYRPATGPAVLMRGGDDFTVTGLKTENGGTIELVSFTATVAGAKLTIYRDTVIERLTDFQRDVFAGNLNDELDHLTMILQEQARDLGRTLKVEVGEDALIFPKPNGDDLIGWDGEGNLVNRPSDETSAGRAEAAAAAAEAAAASVNLPLITPGDIGKTLIVRHDGLGYAFTDRVFDILIKSLPLDLREFGALGNDNPLALVDEGAQIQAAINASLLTGLPLHIPETNYLTGNALTDTSLRDVNIFGQGPTGPMFYMTQARADAGGTMFSFSAGAPVLNTPLLAANVKPNQEKIALTSVVGLEVGMLFTLTSSALWFYDPRSPSPAWKKGEMHVITRIFPGTNEIVLDGSTRYGYNIATETVTCHAAWTRKYRMENIHADLPMPATAVSTSGFFLSGGKDAEIENLSVRGMTSDGITLRRHWRPRLNKGGFEGRSLEGIGYGVSCLTVVGAKLTRLSGRSIRRLFDFNTFSGDGAGISRDVLVEDFHMHGGGYGWDTLEFYPSLASGSITSEGVVNSGGGGHGGVDGMVIKDGFVENVRDGLTIRSKKTVIRNVQFRGYINRCIYATHGVDLDIQNCGYDLGTYPDVIPAGMTEDRTTNADYFLFIGTDTGGTTFGHDLPIICKNNRANGLRKGFVNVSYTASRSAYNMVITGNDAQPRPAPGDSFYFIDASNGFSRLYGSEIHSNEFSRYAAGLAIGTRALYAPTIVIGDIANGGASGAIKCGPSSYRMVIPDDVVAQINFPTGIRPETARITIMSNIQTANADITLLANSATPWKPSTGQNAVSGTDYGSDVVFTTTPLTDGTSDGTDAKLNIRHSAAGIISVKNRLGTTQPIVLTITP